MPAEGAADGQSGRKQITTPDGTVAELIETKPVQTGRGSARTKARKRALDILFEAELRGVSPDERLREHTETDETPVRPFTTELVHGVASRRAEIDALLVDCLAADWTMERMPRVDRGLARIAIWEMLNGANSPEVAVEQAVALAQELSTDGSAAFLNGVLSRAKQRIAAGV